MEWDNLDDDEFKEFIKFEEPTPFDTIAHLFDDKVEILFCKVNWDTLETFKNAWDKEQHRLEIQKYKRYQEKDGITYELDERIYYIAMGKRLLKAMKDFHLANKKYVNCRILRVGEGFDTEYYIESFNPDKQLKIQQ